MGYEYDERTLEFLPWARHFARACTSKLPSHLDRDDLQSAGLLGYLRAAARYDSSRGASFRGYCSVRIRGAVLDELRSSAWTPRSIYKDHKRITCITDELHESLQREPTSAELASALGLEETELPEYQDRVQRRHLVSLQDISENTHGDENISLTERLPDPFAARPDATVLFAEDRATLRESLRTLPPRQARIIVLHYLQNVPLRKVARMLTVTPSRVSQLHHQALDRLRQAFQKARSPATE